MRSLRRKGEEEDGSLVDRSPSRNLRRSRGLNERRESWRGEGVERIDEGRRWRGNVAVAGRGKGGKRRRRSWKEEERSWRVSMVAEDGSPGGCCSWMF